MGLLERLFGSSSRAEPAKPGTPAAGADAPAHGDRAWHLLDRRPSLPMPIRPIEENEAQGELAQFYENIKREMQIPEVPAIVKTLAHSPLVLKAAMETMGNLSQNTSLPQPVVSMLLYSAAVALECQYCSSFHRLTCRTIGIDEDTLTALGNDLDALAPERVQAMIRFGTKATLYPKELSESDFEALRQLGISDTEIVEIIGLAALARFTNVMADALKVEVDPMVKQALAA